MSDTTPLLTLPYILPAQAQKHVTHNEALRSLDALVQMRVLDFGVLTPPATPDAGDIYGLGTDPTDAWAGQGGKIALWDGTAWVFLTPQEGWRTWSVAEAALRVYSGGSWLGVIPPLENLTGVGIGTTSDATNRLAVAADATLLSHAGAGHQLKLNKAADTDTASLLFQSNWAGHAEMGLAGDTDFRLKVSPDGTTFHDALHARADDGVIMAPCLMSQRIEIPDNTAIDIPTPGTGGIVAISLVGQAFPQSAHAGIFSYDTGSSLSLVTLAAGDRIDNLGTTVLTGSTGTDNNTSIAVVSGALRLESRYSSGPSPFAITFLNAF